MRLEPSARHMVLPDGCMDLVFRDSAEADLFWVGPMTRVEIVSVATPTRFLGIRFRPGVAPALLGVDARDIVDQDMPSRDARLLDALTVASSDAACRDLLLAAVTALGQRASTPDPLVLSLSAAILDSGGTQRVADLAGHAGVSERTLRRRFLAGVGYGPKQLCRIARLLAARALGQSGIGGARLAAEAGYFDQAHLCHELASFGLTSASLVA
jgi:AraC-like DNA-binding protein